jgi:PKD repeat protein
MKKTVCALLLVLTLTAAVPVGAITVYPVGDLLIGFSTEAGSDVIYDLGQESSLTDGKSWNLASLLTSYGNYSTLYWGVIGNSTNAGTVRTAWTTTITGIVPNTVLGNGAFGKLNTVALALAGNGPGGAIAAGQSATPAASYPNSWNTETLTGTLAGNYINAYENPNVLGVTSADFSRVNNDGSTPTLLGNFTLAASGVVTYHTVSTSPTPPVAGFSGNPTVGFAPLAVVFTDASTGSITNWLWSFGDGQSVTNGSNASVNHTYTAPGNYTVTLTVTGAGGSNTDAMTAYVIVSSKPQIGSVKFSSGQLVLSGTNCPPGVQYRILTSTNLSLPLASWTPVVTNTFSGNGTYAYTNAISKPTGFFRLVSP